MNVKRKLWQKVLSCFLALLIIIQVLPMSVFAEDAIQKQAIEATKPQAEDNDDNIVIETEIESMRTENSKTFLTANNEFYQVTSLKPIHNYNGKEWIDKIDCEDLSILSTDDVENYIDLQAESTQGTDNLVQSNEHNNCIYEYEYDASGRVTSILFQKQFIKMKIPMTNQPSITKKVQENIFSMTLKL